MAETRLTFLPCNKDRALHALPYTTGHKLNANGTVTVTFQDNSKAVSPMWILKNFTEQGIAFDLATRSQELGSTQLLHAFCRFTPDGDPETGTYTDRDTLVDIRDLTKLVDTPEFLVNFVKRHIKAFVPAPWTNQEQYEKIFRTKKLLGAFDTPKTS